MALFSGLELGLPLTVPQAGRSVCGHWSGGLSTPSWPVSKKLNPGFSIRSLLHPSAQAQGFAVSLRGLDDGLSSNPNHPVA